MTTSHEPIGAGASALAVQATANFARYQSKRTKRILAFGDSIPNGASGGSGRTKSPVEKACSESGGLLQQVGIGTFTTGGWTSTQTLAAAVSNASLIDSLDPDLCLWWAFHNDMDFSGTTEENKADMETAKANFQAWVRLVTEKGCAWAVCAWLPGTADNAAKIIGRRAFNRWLEDYCRTWGGIYIPVDAPATDPTDGQRLASSVVDTIHYSVDGEADAAEVIRNRLLGIDDGYYPFLALSDAEAFSATHPYEGACLALANGNLMLNSSTSGWGNTAMALTTQSVANSKVPGNWLQGVKSASGSARIQADRTFPTGFVGSTDWIHIYWRQRFLDDGSTGAPDNVNSRFSGGLYFNGSFSNGTAKFEPARIWAAEEDVDGAFMSAAIQGPGTSAQLVVQWFLNEDGHTFTVNQTQQIAQVTAFNYTQVHDSVLAYNPY